MQSADLRGCRCRMPLIGRAKHSTLYPCTEDRNAPPLGGAMHRAKNEEQLNTKSLRADFGSPGARRPKTVSLARRPGVGTGLRLMALSLPNSRSAHALHKTPALRSYGALMVRHG